MPPPAYVGFGMPTDVSILVVEQLSEHNTDAAIITRILHQWDEANRVNAPQTVTVDGCGAGATFCARFIDAHLRGWDLEESVRFATAAASLKVTRAGLVMFPFEEIRALAAKIEIEGLAIPASE